MIFLVLFEQPWLHLDVFSLRTAMNVYEAGALVDGAVLRVSTIGRVSWTAAPVAVCRRPALLPRDLVNKLCHSGLSGSPRGGLGGVHT